VEKWQTWVALFVGVLAISPLAAYVPGKIRKTSASDGKEAYDPASYHFHETLFEFSQALALNHQWLQQHPEDLAALSNFAEKHFTTGRFTEWEKRLAFF
jgi:hypothetical protein